MLKATAQTTKEQLVQAALETVKQEGFAGASARAIARRGGLNQALIFYHFGTVQNLLLAALDVTSANRLARYETATSDATDVGHLMQTARQLHVEDVESGHVTVLSEMIAGSVGNPELGEALVERMEPWLDLVERAIEQALGDSPLAQVIPSKDVAFAIVALYLGIDLLAHLDGDRAKVERLFELGATFAPALSTFMNPGRDV